MDPEQHLRKLCIEMALKTPDVRPNAVHIVMAAEVYEHYILTGIAKPSQRAERDRATAA